MAAVALATLRLLVPPLSASSHKGQAGKIGVLGGCAEYTGAPFYAALSALKLGADLSHVFCDREAAVPIKSYSPELIVHGCLNSGADDASERTRQADEVSKWFPALSALVVGPGLGRDEALQAVAAIVVERAVAASLPCVLDADGLRLVIERPELVRGAKWCVLTPNKAEYGRLLDAFASGSRGGGGCGRGGGEGGRGGAQADPTGERVAELARQLGGLTLVRKGPTDLISDGVCTLECSETGSLKRSGGQGDVLAGLIATMLSWSKMAATSGRLAAQDDAPAAAPLAAYAACTLTRRCSKLAFARQRRAMTAPDLIEAIGPVFEEFSPTASEGEADMEGGQRAARE
jgi:ATP-dependent NAD(P)H-hydrate dehydratase